VPASWSQDEYRGRSVAEILGTEEASSGPASVIEGEAFMSERSLRPWRV
jgi:hypothetical protein